MDADGFWRDVLAEPEALTRALAAHRDVDRPDPTRFRRTLMIGMGSSLYAARSAAAYLRAGGVDAHTELASTATPMPPSDDTLCLVISASGSTEETVAAAARHHGTSRVVAVTNNPDAALTAHADQTLLVGAGVETGGVACRSFQCTLALLYRLAGVADHRLTAAVPAVAALIEQREAWLGDVTSRLEAASLIVVVAPAERISSACQGALMLREAPRMAAFATETGEWLHTDVYLSRLRGYAVCLFGGSRFDAAVLGWVRERRATAISIGRSLPGTTAAGVIPGGADPVLASLVEVTTLELAAAALWRQRLASGRMP